MDEPRSSKGDDNAFTIDARIRHIAARRPDAPAILAPGRPTLDYRSLVERIDHLADALAARGIGPGDRVAIMLPKGPEMAVALFGVSAVAAAAPIDPAARPDSFAHHIDLVRARALVTRRGLDPAIEALARGRGMAVVEVDWSADSPAGALEVRGDGLARGCDRPTPAAAAEALVLLTSGTTSTAKVVPRSHQVILTGLDALIEACALTPADRTVHSGPMHYGGGLLAGLSVAFCAGGSIVIPETFDPRSFLGYLADYGATWYRAGYTFLMAILAHARAHPEELERVRLRFIRSSSGRLEPDVMEGIEAAFGAPVIEGYAMTEANSVAINPLPPGRRKPGCVGMPIGCEVGILDDSGRMCATGRPGEIVLRGGSVFAGYDGDEAANAAAFVDGWFRTGDLGRLDDEGYLWIVGRIKEMINRGGQKVSPYEVEEALAAHAEVASAACFAIPHPTLGEEVAAAVVPVKGAAAMERELRQHAMRRLAPHKVPRRFVFVEKLPLGANGKVRRTGLAAELGIDEADGLGKPPATETERRVAALFAAVLGRQSVGVDRDFFLSGGDSLVAVRLMLEIEEAFGVALPHAVLFESGTVEELAAIIDGGARSTCLVPVKADGGRPPFFCVHDGTGQVLNFGDLARLLGADQPLYGLQSRGLDGREPPLSRVEDMARHYLEEIRQVQPHGPYLIGGYSFGGRVAFEIGCILRRQGEPVALLALIDTYARGPGRRARASYREWVDRHLQGLAATRPGEYPAYLGRRFSNLSIMARRAVATRRAARALVRHRATGGPIDPRHIREINSIAGSAYRPGVYPGDVVLFCGELFARAPADAHDRWRAHVGGRLIKRAVSGNHMELIKAPHVETLARELRLAIDQALGAGAAGLAAE